MPSAPEASSPYALLDEIERARDVLVLTYTASLEFFERFALSDARALGALVTVVSDARMVRADPVVVRRAGVHYLDARAVSPGGTAFHPKLFVVVGDGQATVAIGSGNLTMAGWHGNAETWTVLRADDDGGPNTLRDVSAFLRNLSDSEVALSTGAPDALRRVAGELDQLPAGEPGPRLLDSLEVPILEQLTPPSDSVEELMLYAPFHDAQLKGSRALLDRLAPERWTVFVQPDTVVEGAALQALANDRGGRIAWVSRRSMQDDGTHIHDERYWHGKVAQWRTATGQTWALTGSPNLSAPALLNPIGHGGNCELAVVSRIDHDLTPAEGDPPPAGLTLLLKPRRDTDQQRGPVLLSAVAVAGTVTVELHGTLDVEGMFERYDVVQDRWTATSTVSAGSDRYDLDVAAAPIGRALRLRTADGSVSNDVFVADPERLRRRQQQAIGKVRGTPGDVVRDGLGPQLLADIDELRGHLLAVGATVPVSRPLAPEHREGGEEAELPVARPAPGQSLEEFLEACDPVLGQRMTEFALVLPALPSVGAALDDEVGTLDTDTDETTVTDGETDRGDPAQGTIREELLRQSPDERSRYRWFVERLVERAPGYPLLVRNLALRTLLHSIAADLWPDEEWPRLLADALRALAAAGDEPRPEERTAAGSLAAVGLALLRTDVPRMSVRNERQIRYVSAGAAVTGLLNFRDAQQIEMLAADLPGRLAGPAGAQAAEQAVDEILNPPPRGVDRAVRLLAEEHGIDADATGDATILFEEPLPNVPEFMMILALRLADEPGPIFARGTSVEGRPVLGAWCAPWLAVERVGKTGMAFGRAWELVKGQTLQGIDLLTELPRADRRWNAGEPRPDDIRDLLALADDDSPRQPRDVHGLSGQPQP